MVGHTHAAFELRVPGRGLVVNPAALLRAPADGDEGPPATATFGVLELPPREGAALEAVRFTVHDVTTGSEVAIPRTVAGWGRGA